MSGRPYAEVIGDPIAHSKSPLIHNFWLGKLGIDAEYRACHVRTEELADYFTRRRGDAAWRGCNVTIPHKEAALPNLDVIGESAETVGAVNTVWCDPEGQLVGINTDVDGVLAAVGGRIGWKDVVIGSGGAARAAFVLLSALPSLDVTVLARSTNKARRAASESELLRPRILPFAPESGAFEGATLIINATQLGMEGQEQMPAFVLDELVGMATGGVVLDMVYAPLETALLRCARDAGLEAIDGLVMLVGQARVAFSHFFGRLPPPEYDDELRRLLTA